MFLIIQGKIIVRCYQGKMLPRQNVIKAKCNQGKMLPRQNVTRQT